MDLVSALEEARVCLSVLRAERNDVIVWEAFIANASSIAEVHNIAQSIPRTTERQQHRKNVDADSASADRKRSLYLPFLDHLKNEIDERFVKPPPCFQAQLLIPGEKTLIMLCRSSM